MKTFLTIFILLLAAKFSLQGASDQYTYSHPDSLPVVLPDNRADLIDSRLRNEAVLRFGTHQLPSNLKDWEVYRNNLKEKIINKAGVVVNHDLPVDIRETRTLKRPGYTIKNIFFQTRPGIYATANLYIPDGKGPFPGVVVMCGHSTNGRLYENYQSVGHTLALNGYVALAVDPWGAGERTTKHGTFEYHGANLGASLMNIGESLMGMQITDNIRGVDLLCSLPFVDKDNIGATGASGGGNQTMWLAAMDERVKAAVPVVSVGTFESYVMRSNCVCEMLIDGLTFTEEAGVLALARAIMPINAKLDNPAFLASEMLRSYNNAKPIFELKSSGDNISHSIWELTHGYLPEYRQVMLGWFDLKMKGIGTGKLKEEIPFELVPPEELMTFTNEKRDSRVMSTEEYCRKRGEELRNNYLANAVFNVIQKREELKNILRINEKSELKDVFRYSVVNGWERFVLETTDGKLIPLLHLAPVNKSAGYIILTDPAGKSSISSDYINELKKSGAGVVLADLTGTGEASSTKENLSRAGFALHTLSRSEIWLGKTVIGEWVKELDIISAFLKSEFKAQKITLDGSKETALAGLFLGAVKGKFDNIS